MDIDDPKKEKSSSFDTPLELEFEDPPPQKQPELTPTQSASAEPHPSQSKPASPFAAGPHKSQTTAATPVGQKPEKAEKQPKIIIYDEDKSKAHTTKLLLFTTIFGLIGALGYAGISAFYFAIGRRAGIIFIAFFATLGARLGADNLLGNRVRWYAAFTAAGSALVGKAMLVLLLFNMYSDFSAEDWMNFANPGKSAAIYFEQSIVNALSTGGADKRTGQERLDDRFEQEFIAEEESQGYDELYQDEQEDDYYEDEVGEEETEDFERERKPLSFAQVYSKLFDIFDLPLIIAAMFFAFKFARNES